MSPSPDAQVIIVKNFVSRPEPRACISTLIHVPGGVSAFHDATSSSKANATGIHSEVHEPLWKAIPRAPNGSS